MNHDFSNNQTLLEKLYKKYKIHSIQTIIFYLLTILWATMVLISNEYFDSYTYLILILLLVSLSLFTIYFHNSFKARYVFYKSINKIDKVEYKVAPIVYLLTCIPFLIMNGKQMRQELNLYY